VRCNSLSPGGIYDNQPDSFLKKYKNHCGVKGMLSPQDITGSLVFLLSDASQFINGQNIIVDDGFSI
jgi:enoyl-[acyl-carrier-protein] reductase (NADH)